MKNEKKQKYLCVSCNCYFGHSGDKLAECPTCGEKRKDNLNQLEKNEYECVKCGCIFSDFSEKPECPNKC